MSVLVGLLLALLVAMSMFPDYAALTESPQAPVGRAPMATEVVVAPRHLGTVSRYLFGANLFWAYDAEGAFDPLTGTFFPGFTSALRRLGVTALRYPGGTTSDSFDWLRAIGPERERLANEPYGMQAARLSSSCCVLDGPAPSTVGPDEFGRLLSETSAVGTMTVNFATGTVRQAADLVAYMTAPQSGHPSTDPSRASYWAGLRAKDGHPAPYDVAYWEVGNEQYFWGQSGWRSGRLVRLGPHAPHCPAGEVATCLYVFGGTTAFSDQAVGTFADELPSASYSTGAAHQVFYVYFPPIVPASTKVYVDGRRWAEVGDLPRARPNATVYALSSATGAITFGNGAHGEIPPKGAKVTVSYESGPHGGFIEFYQAMKAMNPHIRVCEAEGANVLFLELMGRKYPYDCVQLHDYARPPDVLAPLGGYEERLMAFPVREGAALGKLQAQVRRYSGRNVPILLTEYGQLAAPVPAADPTFNLSLDEGLLVGAQLVEWADHGVPVAEKYLLTSSLSQPGEAVAALASKRLASKRLASKRLASKRLASKRLGPGLALEEMRRTDAYMVRSGLSAYSAMIVRQGDKFLTEPTGLVIGLMAHLGGSERVQVSLHGDPVMGSRATDAPALWALASVRGKRQLYLVVVNSDPVRAIRAKVLLKDFRHSKSLQAAVVDGPSATAYNTASHPKEVTTTVREEQVGEGNFEWSFPAHSVTLLSMWLASPTGPAAQRKTATAGARTERTGRPKQVGTATRGLAPTRTTP